MTYDNVHNDQQKYGKRPAKLAEETLWNSPLPNTYKREISSNNKSITMIDPITGWLEVTQYSDKKSMTIANLIETMRLSRYPWLLEVMYNRRREFIDQELRKILIKNKYGIKT